MSSVQRRRSVAIAVAAWSVFVVGLLPADAGPLPPACDPTVSGVGVPACPSVLLGEAGNIQDPTISLPDLVPDVTEVYVAYESIDFDQATGQWTFGPAVLNFDTRAQNLGHVPLDLNADEPGNLAGSSVSQCISWTTNLVCRQRTQVGGFIWHDEHKHYHFEGFAAYELRSLLPDGRPDFGPDGLLATSPKVSFCLIDSAQIRADALPVGRYNTCNPLEEGISPGWTDVYPSGIEGQSLSLNGLSDGRYALVLSMNTAHRVLETNPTNNRVVATVEIRNLGTLFPDAGIVDKRLS